MNKLKRIGPRTLPAGTPLATGQGEEKEEPTRTDCVREPGRPGSSIAGCQRFHSSGVLSISFGWEMESKTRWKSTYPMTMDLRFDMDNVQSFMDSRRLVHVE